MMTEFQNKMAKKKKNGQHKAGNIHSKVTKKTKDLNQMKTNLTDHDAYLQNREVITVLCSHTSLLCNMLKPEVLFYSTESWGWKQHCDDVGQGQVLTRNVCTCMHIIQLNKHMQYSMLAASSTAYLSIKNDYVHLSYIHTKLKNKAWALVFTDKAWVEWCVWTLPHSIVGVGEEQGWCKLRQRQILISLLQKASSFVVFHVLAGEAFPLLYWWIQHDPESTAGELQAQTVGIAFCSVSAFMWKWEHCGQLSVEVAE